MIGKIIYSFIVFVIAVCIGLWLKAEPGYVLISYGHWTVESTLWFVVIALAIFFVIVHYLMKIICGIWAMPSQLRRWQNDRK